MTKPKTAKATPVECNRCGREIGTKGGHHIIFSAAGITIACVFCVSAGDVVRFIWSRGQIRGRYLSRDPGQT